MYIYKIAYSIIRDAKEMPDATQDILCRIWSVIDKINKDNEKAVISTIARNAAINMKKRKFTDTTKTVSMDEEADYSTYLLSGMDPVDILVDQESVDYIYSKISSLDKKYADILIMRCEAGCTPEEISNILNVNIKTVYTRYYRARNILRGLLSEMNKEG